MFVLLTTWAYGERVPTAVNTKQIRYIYESDGQTFIVFGEQHEIAVAESFKEIEQLMGVTAEESNEVGLS